MFIKNRSLMKQRKPLPINPSLRWSETAWRLLWLIQLKTSYYQNFGGHWNNIIIITLACKDAFKLNQFPTFLKLGILGAWSWQAEENNFPTKYTIFKIHRPDDLTIRSWEKEFFHRFFRAHVPTIYCQVFEAI